MLEEIYTDKDALKDSAERVENESAWVAVCRYIDRHVSIAAQELLYQNPGDPKPDQELWYLRGQLNGLEGVKKYFDRLLGGLGNE